VIEMKLTKVNGHIKIVDGIDPASVAAACALPLVHPLVHAPAPMPAPKRPRLAPLPPPHWSWQLDHVGGEVLLPMSPGGAPLVTGSGDQPPGGGLLVLHAPCSWSCKLGLVWAGIKNWLGL
jgi:hypothetical protein